jgi:hypothetical protein
MVSMIAPKLLQKSLLDSRLPPEFFFMQRKFVRATEYYAVWLYRHSFSGLAAAPEQLK